MHKSISSIRQTEWFRHSTACVGGNSFPFHFLSMINMVSPSLQFSLPLSAPPRQKCIFLGHLSPSKELGIKNALVEKILSAWENSCNHFSSAIRPLWFEQSKKYQEARKGCLHLHQLLAALVDTVVGHKPLCTGFCKQKLIFRTLWIVNCDSGKKGLSLIAQKCK